MKKLKVYWPFLPFVIFLIAGIVGWFVLPAEMTVRGDGTMPKLFALLMPVALGAFGGSLAAREKTRWAGVAVVVLTAVLEIMLFAWNANANGYKNQK